MCVTILKETSLCSASYVSCRHDSARMCCCRAQFAAERRAAAPLLLSAGACSNRSICPAHRVLSSKPAARQCCGRSMGQTDGRTDGHSTVSQTLLRNRPTMQIASVGEDDDDDDDDDVDNIYVYYTWGGSVAEWLACWTQALKGQVSNRSRDAVG